MTTRRIVQGAIALVILAVVADVLSAYALFYSAATRAESMSVVFEDEGRMPASVLLHRVSAIVSRLSRRGEPACKPFADPSPLYRRDPVYGYGIAPGRYELTMCPSDPKAAQRYRWAASIDADGGRRTGYRDPQAAPRIVFLGDSWIFGWSLNDEQTASWLLQDYVHGRYTVKNFAQTGGGSAQELITVRRMAGVLGPDDIVVLGYADYYNPRNVAAPQRIAAEAGVAEVYKGPGLLQHPRAAIKDGHVIVDFLPLDCALLGGYCTQPDPPLADMQAVTVAIYQEIISSLRARVAVLHLAGPDDDPVVRFLEQQAGVTVIDARLERATFFEDDDIPGYDHHPGALANDAFFHLMRGYLDKTRR
jgi:hypothetical protein